MAMTVGSGKKGPLADMNVTPLIDVLLVLLIIFMVITPLMPNGLDALVPQPKIDRPEETLTPRAIVVTIDAQNQIKINQQPTSIGVLGSRLADIFKTRNDRVIFVKGDPSLHFADVTAVIDIARGAGVETIGLITKAVEEG